MKSGIHPEVFNVVVTCVCGAEYQTTSTKKISRTDICANCHPFYTGKQKIIDTEGRIDKFKKKFGSTYMDNTKKKK